MNIDDKVKRGASSCVHLISSSHINLPLRWWDLAIPKLRSLLHLDGWEDFRILDASFRHPWRLTRTPRTHPTLGEQMHMNGLVAELSWEPSRDATSIAHDCFGSFYMMLAWSTRD